VSLIGRKSEAIEREERDFNMGASKAKTTKVAQGVDRSGEGESVAVWEIEGPLWLELARME
jgi:hypothetical protein